MQLHQVETRHTAEFAPGPSVVPPKASSRQEEEPSGRRLDRGHQGQGKKMERLDAAGTQQGESGSTGAREGAKKRK